MKKFIYFLILFLVLFSMLSWSLDALDVIDVKAALYNLASKIPAVNNYLVNRAELVELETENKELQNTIDAKDTEIAELKKEIENFEKELADQKAVIAETQNKYNELVDSKKSREAKLEKIADIYRSMDSEAAAAVIMQMEQNLALEILSRLKEDQAAAILESLSQERAAELFSLLSQ